MCEHNFFGQLEERCTRPRTMHVMKRSEFCHLAIDLHPSRRAIGFRRPLAIDRLGRSRAGELGAHGAFFRLHHFARRSVPFVAVGAKTKRIEIGTSNSHFGILRLWTAFGPLSAPTQ
jgi:hypothetical protein